MHPRAGTLGPAALSAACLLLAPGIVGAQPTEGASPAWPPSTDGLAFRWENGSESNTIPVDGPVDQLCRLIPRGQGRFDRFWAMDVAGGAFHAEPVMNVGVLERLRASNRLTLEVVVTPASTAGAGPGHIVSYGTSLSDRSFALAQEGERLLFGVDGPRARQAPWLEIGRLDGTGARHVVVTVGAGSVTGYVDGRRTTAHAVGPIDASEWPEGELSFGQAPDGSADWAGTIEGVTIYDRALTPEEVGGHHRAYAPRLERRDPLPRLEVEARLVEKREIPRASVYPNTLVVYDYRVTAVHRGSYAEDELLVSHWGNLNGERQLATQDLRVGRSYRLVLEPFGEHPELAAIRLVRNEEDYHLPLYHAVSDPPRD